MPKAYGRRKPSFKLPNRLITDGALSFSARRMGAVLYSRRNQLGTCRRSLTCLAKLAHCSVATARKALEELEKGGYITRCRHYKYNEQQGRLVYDQYTYYCNLRFDGGFTLVPRDLFGHPLKSSAFVLCLYLYLQIGNTTRAFPSLNHIGRDLWMSKATICRAVKALKSIGRIYVQFCIKTNCAHSNNSYFFLCGSAAEGQYKPQERREPIYPSLSSPPLHVLVYCGFRRIPVQLLFLALIICSRTPRIKCFQGIGVVSKLANLV